MTVFVPFLCLAFAGIGLGLSVSALPTCVIESAESHHQSCVSTCGACHSLRGAYEFWDSLWAASKSEFGSERNVDKQLTPASKNIAFIWLDDADRQKMGFRYWCNYCSLAIYWGNDWAKSPSAKVFSPRIIRAVSSIEFCQEILDER